MPSGDSIAYNDGVSKAGAASAENSPAHIEAWDAIKNLVVDRKTAPTVLRGDAGWGDVILSSAPAHVVEGLLGGESGKMHQIGSNQFAGNLPWGSTNLKFENGRLAGHGPWGDVSLKVDANSVSGNVPWGKINLTLRGQDLSGPTPWGTAHLKLGEKYRTLTNPDVLSALSAIMSDR